MENYPPTRESLLRYLLNELDDDERERVDTLLISDEQYHATFQEVEYDLRDALAAGELTPEEAERARRALRSAGSMPQRDPALAPRLVAERTTPSKNPDYWRVWVAAAAVVLATLAAGFRLLRIHQAGPLSVARAAVPLSIPESPVGDGEPIIDGLPPRPGSEHVAPRLKPFALLLLPGASRSPRTLHLAIPRDAGVVKIDWPSTAVDAKDNRYQLRILTDTGKIACTTRGKATPGADLPIVRFVCPAGEVPSGTDFMRVTPIPADPEIPSLLEVTVSVKRKPATGS